MRRLRALWAEHCARPFPLLAEDDSRAQEVAYYASWVGSLVEAAIAARGRLDSNQQKMLAVRHAEGNQAVWAAAGELGEPARALVARLLALEDLLTALNA
ncbi:MAG TPA: hypothetical protein VF137_12360 [Candidatus Dormibacteraeota bacterium]